MATSISNRTDFSEISTVPLYWEEIKDINIRSFPYPSIPSVSTDSLLKMLRREDLSITITDSISSTLTYLEEKNCEIKNEIDIRNFLLKNFGVIPYLWQAIIKIFEYFGENQKTALELMFDPEIEKDEGELFLNIITNLEPEEALARLDKIDEEWLIPVVAQNALNFNLNFEFI